MGTVGIDEGYGEKCNKINLCDIIPYLLKDYMSNYSWGNKEELIKDLKLSESTSDFLNNQGLVATSGNYDTFKKWIKFHGIDKDQYFKIKNKSRKENVTKLIKVLTKESVLCFNSDYSRKEADKVIRKENLIQYKCRGCNNEGEWCGKCITLQLEHKNGDSTDHRIENLEYLCPNCHSQTLTYGSKNKHNRVFEARIKDLIELGEVNYSSLNILSQKWKVGIYAVRRWVLEYQEKIENKKIILCMDKPKELVDKIQIVKLVDLSLIKQRIQQINEVKESKDFQDKLSLSWNITKNGVRKWIKKYAVDIYHEKYVLTPSYKFKLYQKDLYNKVLELIEKCDQDNEYDINKLKIIFSNKVGVAASYIKSKFPNYYKRFYPTPECIYCKSIETLRFGLIKNKHGNIQRYKCLNCNKQFYENLIKTLDMVEQVMV